VRVYDKEGCRLTSCCECYSTYSMDDGSLTCKKCHREVPEGEGDGMEYRILQWRYIRNGGGVVNGEEFKVITGGEYEATQSGG